VCQNTLHPQRESVDKNTATPITPSKRDPQKETYKRDLQKRPIKETYKRKLWQRPIKISTKETYKREIHKSKKTYKKNVHTSYLSPRNMTSSMCFSVAKETYKRDLNTAKQTYIIPEH